MLLFEAMMVKEILLNSNYNSMMKIAKYPKAKNNEKYPFLKGLDADTNPIVILIE